MEWLKNVWDSPGLIDAVTKLLGTIFSASAIFKGVGYWRSKWLAKEAYESLKADLVYITQIDSSATMRDVRARENRISASMRTAELMAKYTLHYLPVRMRTNWGSLVNIGYNLKEGLTLIQKRHVLSAETDPVHKDYLDMLRIAGGRIEDIR